MTTGNEPGTVEPYLFFDGRCEEALQFYKKALGAEIEMMMRFKESPDAAHNPPGSEEKILHASIRIGKSRLLASDGHCQGKPSFQGFGISLAAENIEEVDRWFAALSEGGEVQMPLAKTFFAPKFGMVKDRFGVSWMVIAPH